MYLDRLSNLVMYNRVPRYAIGTMRSIRMFRLCLHTCFVRTVATLYSRTLQNSLWGVWLAQWDKLKSIRSAMMAGLLKCLSICFCVKSNLTCSTRHPTHICATRALFAELKGNKLLFWSNYSNSVTNKMDVRFKSIFFG